MTCKSPSPHSQRDGIVATAKHARRYRHCTGECVVVAAVALLFYLLSHSSPTVGQVTRQGNMVVVVTDNPLMIPNMSRRRKAELERAVRLNLDSPYVSQLHLLNEAENSTLLPGQKLRVYSMGWRTTFLDAIRYANAVLEYGSTFVVANADIVFSHESVRLIARINDPNVVVALSRHDVLENETTVLHKDPPVSQDAWFMRTPFPEDPRFDFPMGALGSDNKLAIIYAQLNKTVVNYCADVIIWHLHSSQQRRDKARLPKPYMFVPKQRVNTTVLNYSWQKQVRALSFGRGSVDVLALDLPWISEHGVNRSNTRARALRPTWPPPGMHRLLQHGRNRLGDANMPSRSVYYVEAPWSAFARDGQLGVLHESLDLRMPGLAYDRMCTHASKESLPFLCRSNRWSRMTIAISQTNAPVTYTQCPPLPIQSANLTI